MEKKIIELSASRVKKFKQCELSYYYCYVEKIKQEDTYYTVIGNFIHKVLENVVNEKNNEKDLKKLIKFSYNKTLEDKDKELSKIIEKITPEMKNEVKKWLDNYYKFETKNKKLDDALQAELAFQLPIEKNDYTILIRGFVDRIDCDKKNKTIEIIDYKTAKNYKYLDPFQLYLYSIPVQNVFPDYKVISGSYQLVRYDYDFLKYEIDEEKQKEALTECEEVVEKYIKLMEINNIEAWKKNRGPLCSWCTYKNKCQKLTEANDPW